MAARPSGTRITGGTLRGEVVQVLPGRKVRPMRARVREAMFAMLGAAVDGARVIDAYAGSGALGAEAVSRGAAFVLFVERDPRVLAVLDRNRRTLGLLAQTDVAVVDLHRAVPASDAPFDLLLLDPPFPDYREGDEQSDPWRIAARVAEMCLRDGAQVVIEHPRGARPPAGSGAGPIEWREPRRYGETELSLGRRVE